jgi:hypothetical protein
LAFVDITVPKPLAQQKPRLKRQLGAPFFDQEINIGVGCAQIGAFNLLVGGRSLL